MDFAIAKYVPAPNLRTLGFSARRLSHRRSIIQFNIIASHFPCGSESKWKIRNRCAERETVARQRSQHKQVLNAIAQCYVAHFHRNQAAWIGIKRPKRNSKRTSKRKRKINILRVNRTLRRRRLLWMLILTSFVDNKFFYFWSRIVLNFHRFAIDGREIWAFSLRFALCVPTPIGIEVKWKKSRRAKKKLLFCLATADKRREKSNLAAIKRHCVSRLDQW